MSNAARILKDAKPKPPREPRAKKVKADLGSLPPAVVKGVLQVKVGSKIIFQRTLDGKTKLHKGQIKSTDEKGYVTVWDETRCQWWAFELKQADHVRAASTSELISAAVEAPAHAPETPGSRPDQESKQSQEPG